MAIVRPDRKNTEGAWVKTFCEEGIQYQTKAYQVWSSMMRRCESGGLIQKYHPTYLSCICSASFTDFQVFANWYSTQVGYGKDYAIDKDILICHNKIYSKETCVLVPMQLNSFFTLRLSGRGDLPDGVSICRRTGKFRSVMRVDGYKTWLGYYSSPAKANEVYLDAKDKEAERWLKRLQDGEYEVDQRVLDALRVYNAKDRHDRSKND